MKGGEKTLLYDIKQISFVLPYDLEESVANIGLDEWLEMCISASLILTDYPYQNRSSKDLRTRKKTTYI